MVGMRRYKVTKGGDTKKSGPRTELWDTNRFEKTKNLQRRQRRGIQGRRKTKRTWSPGNQKKGHVSRRRAWPVGIAANQLYPVRTENCHWV